MLIGELIRNGDLCDYNYVIPKVPREILPPQNCIHRHTECFTFQMIVLLNKEGPDLHLIKISYPEFSTDGGGEKEGE